MAFPNPGATVGEEHTMPDGRVFVWNGTDWVVKPTPAPIPNPTTTLGDMLIRGTTTVDRLAIGVTEGEVLTVDHAATHHATWKTKVGAVVATSAPTPPVEGTLWYDSTNFRLMVRLSAAWIQVA